MADQIKGFTRGGMSSLVTGDTEMIQTLRRLIKHSNKVRGVVGYTASYAPAVHEADRSFKKPGARKKFLESALKESEKQIMDELKRASIARPGSLRHAMRKATLLVERRAAKYTPVDTGNLIGSLFSKVFGG